MGIDHWMQLAAVLLPCLLGGGGLVWKLMDRMDQKQKKQLDETKKQLEMLTDIKSEVEDIREDVGEMKTEVGDHTVSINEIKDKVDLLGDESKESLRRNLLEDFASIDEKGYITTEEKACWEKNYRIYSELGGNGEIKLLDTEIQKLTPKSKRRGLRRRKK